MHPDEASASHLATGPIDGAGERSPKAAGLGEDVLRAAGKVLENYVAAQQRVSQLPIDVKLVS